MSCDDNDDDGRKIRSSMGHAMPFHHRVFHVVHVQLEGWVISKERSSLHCVYFFVYNRKKCWIGLVRWWQYPENKSRTMGKQRERKEISTWLSKETSHVQLEEEFFYLEKNIGMLTTVHVPQSKCVWRDMTWHGTTQGCSTFSTATGWSILTLVPSLSSCLFSLRKVTFYLQKIIIEKTQLCSITSFFVFMSIPKDKI